MEFMEEITADRLQIAYDGPALRSGRMPMLALASGLRGQALLAERVKDILYGDSVSIRVEVDPEFETGSLVIPIHILSDAVKGARHLLAGEGATALANLTQFLGFSSLSGVSLYKLFKRLKGRRIEKADDLPRNLDINVSVDILIRVYNDPEVLVQLRKTIDPLHYEGIEEFQTRREGIVIERVSKKDLHAADEAELEALTKDERLRARH